MTPKVSNPSSGLPDGRRSHSALCVDGDKLLVFGGYNSRQNRHFNDVWLLDTTTFTWSRRRPEGKPPCHRRRQAAAMVGKKIFFFGGTSPKHQDENG